VSGFGNECRLKGGSKKEQHEIEALLEVISIAVKYMEGRFFFVQTPKKASKGYNPCNLYIADNSNPTLH